MRRGQILVAAWAVMVLGGCQASVTNESPDELADKVRLAPPTFKTGPGPKPEGRFYAVVGGETSNDNRLYELRFSPPSLRLLTEATRVSAVGACNDRVVVAAGQAAVGFSDHLQELRLEDLVPLEGLEPFAGQSPAVAPDCRVAYTWVDRSTEPPVEELRTWDPARKSGTTLYRGEPGDGPLVSPDWGPNGEVAVVRRDPEQAGQLPEGTAPGRAPAIVVVRPDGSTSEIDAGSDPSVFVWGRRWMAVMEEGQEATIFIDPATGERSVLQGWRPLAWSPEGDRLLVRDAATRTLLGLVDAVDPSSVRKLGEASRPVLDADWLPQ